MFYLDELVPHLFPVRILCKAPLLSSFSGTVLNKSWFSENIPFNNPVFVEELLISPERRFWTVYLVWSQRGL